MPTLYLVRHGQGSFGTQHYDRLSPLGERQARLLGSHLRSTHNAFVGAYSGTLERQRRTASIALTQMPYSAPSLGEHAAFNEYDAEAIASAYLPRVAHVSERSGDARRALFSDAKLFQSTFGQILEAWVRGEPHGHPRLESWESFRERFRAALDALKAAHGRRDRVLIFTSGGVVALAVQQALGLDAQHTVRINWSVHNASVTRVHLGRSGLRLLGFNSVDHLERAGDPALITFR